MRVLALVSALSLGSAVFAHPHPQPAEDVSVLEKRQSSTVFVTGPSGNVQPRLEIRQLKDNYPDQYTLLVLAMEQWKQQSDSIDTSFFKVTGIHGMPRQDWNGVGSCGSQCQGADGYATHDSILFPTWHRTYVALFEQEFLKIVKNVANSYPAGDKRTRYVNAANIMRWPYYDWAAHAPAGRQSLPRIISDYTVENVDSPTGVRTLTPNPLFRYDFTDSQRNSMYYSPFTTWTRTYRYPTSNDASASSNEQSAINAFENVRQSLQDQTYQLFTTCKDYNHFSNDDAGSSSTQCKSSLEAIHNTVHTTAGGAGGSVSGGHLTYLPLSSFDPFFWLHHSNVDRIFAMWQRINSDYSGSGTCPHTTWTIPQGQYIDQKTPLKPFRKSYTAFWTPNDVKDWTVFKYTYPEFVASDGSASSITNYVNQLYGPNANAAAGSIQPPKKRGLIDGMVNGIVGGLSDALPGNPLKASNGSTFEYFANIETPRYALGGSYGVFLFNGKPASEDPTSWIMDKNLIGPLGVLAKDGMTNSSIITSGSIPLTRTLQSIVGSNSGILGGLTEALVVPFLTKNLEWRIAGPGGENVDPSTLHGFSVNVVTSTAQTSDDSTKLPTFSDFISLLDVTKGQSGGLNSTVGGGSAPSYM